MNAQTTDEIRADVERVARAFTRASHARRVGILAAQEDRREPTEILLAAREKWFEEGRKQGRIEVRP